MLHGNGKDLVRDAEGDAQALRQTHVRLHLLGDGQGHEEIAHIDDEGGHGQLHHAAAGSQNPRAGHLSGTGQISQGNQHRRPQGQTGQHRRQTKGHGDGKIAKADGKTVPDALEKISFSHLIHTSLI